MYLSALTTLLRRWWWLLVTATLISGSMGYLFGAQMAPTYEATTRLLIGPVHGDLNTQRAASQLTLSYAELIRSQAVVQATIDELSLGVSPSRLAETIQASANTATRVLTVTLESPDPESGATIVNALARNLIAFATRDSTNAEGQLTVIDSARPASAPMASRAGLFGTVGAFIGFFLALVLIGLLEYLDNSIRNGAHASRLTRLPLLTSVRVRRRWGGLRAPGVLLDPASEQGFQVDLLSAKIEFSAGPDKTARSVVLLPVDPRGGNGWLAVNLAVAFGMRGRMVSLLDADPSAEVASLIDQRLSRDRNGTSRLPASVHVYRRPTEELGHLTAEQARDILAATLATHDIAVLQMPPAQAEPNALVWAGVADAVVLLARAGDPAPAVYDLVETLRLTGARLAGLVFLAGPRLRAPMSPARAEPEAEQPLPQN